MNKIPIIGITTDYQEKVNSYSKYPWFALRRHYTECLEIFNYAIKQIEVRSSILEASKYEYIWSVDTLNDWVSSGIPFREAYQNMANAQQIMDLVHCGQLMPLVLLILHSLRHQPVWAFRWLRLFV